MVKLTQVVTPAPTPAWADLAIRDPEALATQTPRWLACVCASGQHCDASQLYYFDDDRRILLPLARRRHLPAALTMEASWPFDWGIGGPLADGPITIEHAAAVYTDLARRADLRLTVRVGPHGSDAWQAAPSTFARTGHSTHVLDLGGGFDAVWAQQFRSSVRRAIRKAERSGLDVEVDHTGRLIPAFDQLYRQSVDRWARAQHEPLALAHWRARRANPAGKFRTVAERLGERCAVWVAWRAGEPAAAIIVLRHGDHDKYWRGAMNGDLAGPSRANDLLHRLAIEAACRAGSRRYHMGDSRPGSGLAAFKEGFGARAYSSWSYRTERLPLIDLDRRLRTLAKRAVRFRDV